MVISSLKSKSCPDVVSKSKSKKVAPFGVNAASAASFTVNLPLLCIN